MACALKFEYQPVLIPEAPLSHSNLQGHQIEAGNQLGHRMLDLQAGIHLKKVKLARGYRAKTPPCRHRDNYTDLAALMAD